MIETATINSTTVKALRPLSSRARGQRKGLLAARSARGVVWAHESIWCPPVAQTDSLSESVEIVASEAPFLWRRLLIGCVADWQSADTCGLPIRDTADFQSALLGLQLRPATPHRRLAVGGISSTQQAASPRQSRESVCVTGFMESLHAIFRAHWAHEPALGVLSVRSSAFRRSRAG